MKATRRTKDAVEILDRMIGNDRELRRLIEQETVSSHVASLIYEARERARLTQGELARLVGTTQSAIARLESADYRGHSLSMLVRIASALGERVEVKLVPRAKGRRSA
jgi:ribosome-binding protein aMBF1 (putative translation factor)